jgi:cation transport regulator ChaC
MPSDSQLVFGYGSLLAHDPERASPARLRGYRRTWDIAMDNTVDLPGYKYYVDPLGHRPPVVVTFVNLLPAALDAVNGIVFEVTPNELAELDARERNYERTEVTGQVEGAAAETIWTYLGSAEARGRYERGFAADRAVVSREYHDGLLEGFASLGDEAVAHFQATTDPPACPIRELARIDLADRP